MINKYAASFSTITSKGRLVCLQEDVASSSENESWESLEKQRRKRNYANAYLCGYYHDTVLERFASE